jgi:hypothetical protein
MSFSVNGFGKPIRNVAIVFISPLQSKLKNKCTSWRNSLRIGSFWGEREGIGRSGE